MAKAREYRFPSKQRARELPSSLLPHIDTAGSEGAGDLEDFARVLELLLDNVYSGIILVDRDSKVLYMNRFYAELLGTDSKKAVGKHIKEYFPESRLPGVVETGKMELGKRCSLRSDIALLVNRIPIKRNGETIGVVLQTIFKDHTELHELMARLSTLEKEVKYYKRGLDSVLSATHSFDSIIGHHKRIVEAKKIAEKYAKTDAAVLILGPTGTGKELFTHAIHKASRRWKGAFVCVNCAAIPRELLESELFGYETGAFTGARRQGKAGKIELAQKGTLFLDEIGDLPLDAQAKLLRVLETRKVEKLGGLKSIEVDFRLIASTNRDLKKMIDHEEFREDLFYRLNALSIDIPSLSQRVVDIPALIKHFLQSMGKPKIRFSGTAMALLKKYAWPGNIRELKNVVERAVSLAQDGKVDVDHLPCEIREFTCSPSQGQTNTVTPLFKAAARCEREILTEALKVTEGNMSKAAKLLGISRSTLYEKCKVHRI